MGNLEEFNRKEREANLKQRIEALEASLKDLILIAEFGKTATSEYEIKKAKKLVY